MQENLDFFLQRKTKEIFQEFVLKSYNYKEGVSGPSVEIFFLPAFILKYGSEEKGS